MTAKEYLNQIRRLDASISARIHELQELQKMATYLTGIRYDADRVQSTKTDTGFPGAERIADLELDIERRIRELGMKRHKIISEIENLDNPKHVQLLVERYVHYKTFDDVADAIGLSYDRTIHMHGEALLEFRKKHSM